MEIFFTILILTLIVSISGVITKVLPFVPLPLIQILLGALLAWPKFGLHIDFNPELFLVLFIPPLLFSDGRKTPINEFLKNWREILFLALVLVIFTVVGIGYLIYWMIPEIPIFAAFALSAVLSPTDAVALSGIIGEGRIPKKLMDILQGEALMNDASGLVSLKFSIAVATGTMVFTISNAFIEFIKVSLGGLLIGIAVTWTYSKSLRFITKWSDDEAATQIILLLLLPFASYLISEHIGFSGILASVTSGMIISQSGIIRNAPLEMRLRGNSVWDMLEFVFNGMVFIMLGLQLPEILKNTISHVKIDPSMKMWMLFSYTVFIYISLIAFRFFWLYFIKYLNSKFLKKCSMIFCDYSEKEILIASFAGVRGSITLAGVLSIPIFLNEGIVFPSRYQLIFIATGVILLSLICGILILPILLKGYVSDSAKYKKEERMARTIASEVAIESLKKMQEWMIYNNKENVDIQVLNEISARIIGNLRRNIDENSNSGELLIAENLERKMRLHILDVKRSEYYHLRAKQKISNETLNKLLRDLDFLEALLIEK